MKHNPKSLFLLSAVFDLMLSITPSGQEVLKESLRNPNLDKVVRDSAKDNKSHFMRNITGIRALQLVFLLLNLKPNAIHQASEEGNFTTEGRTPKHLF